MPDVPAPAPPPRDELVDALLSAGRTMVGLVARAVADQHSDVTLPQYRALVVLFARGPQRLVDIAAELRVNPSTGTRMCDRLVRKGLVRRQRCTRDRREVRLSLTATGRTLVRRITERRRHELEALVEAIPRHWHEPMTEALRSLVAYSGGPPSPDPW